jgi:hypothetical protein
MEPAEVDRLRAIDALFAGALEREGGERAAFLAGCPADLRAEVEELLRHSGEGGDEDELGGSPLAAALLREVAEALDEPFAAGASLAGERAGPFELTREIGRGGMSVVNLARRVDGGFEQTAAVKLVPGAGVDERALRRFDQERRILAGLAHPNIARLDDGGLTTPRGFAYLTMELVDGLPIDRHCRERALDLDARLDLFVQAARAVHFAHRRLVVHRDLKPSNILVAASGPAGGDTATVKLLDFGIATLLPSHAGRLALTASAERFLTLEFASPEQFRGRAGDHRLGRLPARPRPLRAPRRPPRLRPRRALVPGGGAADLRPRPRTPERPRCAAPRPARARRRGDAGAAQGAGSALRLGRRAGRRCRALPRRAAGAGAAGDDVVPGTEVRPPPPAGGGRRRGARRLAGARVGGHRLAGDGRDDLAVGTHFDAAEGTISILHSRAGGFRPGWSWLVAEDTDHLPTELGALFSLGSSLAAGDFDGNRAADLAAGLAWQPVDGHDQAGAVLVLPAQAPVPCQVAPDAHCLQNGRFRLTATFQPPGEAPRAARAVPAIADDSALFWFFDAANWEVLAKVIDGCTVNSHFWLFSAATTNVAYTLRVEDRETGEVTEYVNPPGAAQSRADTSALSPCLPASEGSRPPDPLPAGFSADACPGDPERLCLHGGRFELTVEWATPNGMASGDGRVVPFGTGDSGLFWFFQEGNWELLVKVLDGCPVNGRFWVFSAATTNVEYRLRVHDRLTNTDRVYENPPGVLAKAVTDTDAFGGCS